MALSEREASLSQIVEENSNASDTETVNEDDLNTSQFNSFLSKHMISVVVSPREQKPAEKKQPNSRGRKKEKKLKRILICDDIDFNLQAIEALMTHSLGIDYKRVCLTALSGKEAVEKLKRDLDAHDGKDSSIKLVLMDCQMPLMDGYDATIAIKTLYRERRLPLPHVVAVTGHVSEPYVRKAKASGMDQVLEKPVMVKDLGKILADHGYLDEETK